MQLLTQRCVIRHLQFSDLDALKMILQNKKVMQHVNRRFNDEQVEQWLHEQIRAVEQMGFGMVGVELKESHQFIGICGFTNRLFKKENYIELSYYFSPSYWHHGYACEVVEAMIRYGFDTLQFNQIISIIKDSNLSSIKVAQRCQMKVIEKFHQYVFFKRQLLLIYSIKNVL